jgi:hypothetical protein
MAQKQLGVRAREFFYPTLANSTAQLIHPLGPSKALSNFFDPVVHALLQSILGLH